MPSLLFTIQMLTICLSRFITSPGEDRAVVFFFTRISFCFCSMASLFLWVLGKGCVTVSVVLPVASILLLFILNSVCSCVTVCTLMAA